MTNTTKPALPEPVAKILALATEHAKADKARIECERYIACYEDGPQEQADLRRLTAASATAYEAFVSGISNAIAAAVAEARSEMQERIDDQLRTIKALMVGMPDEGTTPAIRRIAWLEQQLAEARAVPGEGWTDADADAARLALELECLLTDKDVQMATISRWWDSAHEALELHRQRMRGITASPDAQKE